MSPSSERYGTALMSLQVNRAPDLQRGASITHIGIPLPTDVQRQYDRWQQGERDPVLPDEAAQLLWSTPAAAFLTGSDDAWLDVPGVRLLLPGLTALHALEPDAGPKDRAELLSFVAETVDGLSADDLRVRLERSRFEVAIGDLVLLFKYAATGTKRPLGLAADLFRLATILVMANDAPQGQASISALLSAPLQVPRLFGVPVTRKGPSELAPETRSRVGTARRVDLSRPDAVAALSSLERNLEEIERTKGSRRAEVVKRDIRRRTASSSSTISVAGLPIVINTSEVRARQDNGQRELASEVRSALPRGIRGQLDQLGIAVEELRIWPVLCAPTPLPDPVPSYLEPVGRTDLLLVRQTTTGYRRAEVAHVENIMAGETRDREHSSRLTSREETFDSYISETEVTNDLQTTSRSELSHEVSEIVTEDLSAEGNVEVTSRGPTKVVASIGGAYAKSTEDAATIAATYSRETIDRAVERTLERTTRERRSVFERETTEKNQHGFVRDKEAPNHASGVYQYLERVSRARLFWYGEREMYDLLVPEPAALLWSIATRQPETREDPEPPDTVLFESITIANVAEHIEEAIRRFHVVDLPNPPAPTDGDSWATNAKGSGQSSRHSATAEIRIPDGYELVSADYTVAIEEESQDKNPNGVVSIGGRGRGWEADLAQGVSNLIVEGRMDLVESPNPAGAHPLSGQSVTLGFTADNFTEVTFTITLNFNVTEAALQNWRTDAYERIAAKYEQLQQDYEDARSQADMMRPTTEEQLPAGARARLSTIVRHELQRAVITLMRNDPVAFDLMRDYPLVPGDGGLSSHPTPDPVALRAKEAEIRFLQQAFEWEHVSWILYPYFWSRRSRWEHTAVSEHPDPDFSAFLSAGAARVQVPVRPGFEVVVKHFMETGEVYGEGDLPKIGDADYLSFVDEQLTVLGAPTGELPWPVDDPLSWDIVVPTPLVILRGLDEALPTWDPTTGEETVP